MFLPGGPLYKEEPVSSQGQLWFLTLSQVMLWKAVTSITFSSPGWSPLKLHFEKLWPLTYRKVFASHTRKSVCWGETKNRKPADNAHKVPVVLINGLLSSRGEKDRISLMNTRGVLITEQWGTSYSISLSVCSPSCARMESSQITGNDFGVFLIRRYVSLGRTMNWRIASTSTLCFTRKGLEKVPRHGDCTNFSQTGS